MYSWCNVIVVRNGHGDRVQILHDTVCISHAANIFRKGMNPTIIHLAMEKY